MKSIESIHNPLIKSAKRLQTKKERDKTGLFLIEGWHLIEEANKKGCLQSLFLLQDEKAPFKPDIEPIYCSKKVMDALSQQSSQAKAIAICKRPEFKDKPLEKLLFLEELQDPGNVGTLLRSAYAFGIDGVIFSKGCADPYGFKTIQASQGAIFFEPVFFDFEPKLQACKKEGIPLLAATLHQKAKPAKELKLLEAFGLVIGNEGAGLSKKVLEQCDQYIEIEMKHFESLNAAIAGSILLYLLT